MGNLAHKATFDTIWFFGTCFTWGFGCKPQFKYYQEYPEQHSKIWTDIVRNEFKLEHVQFVSDLLEPSMPINVVNDQIKKINYYTKKNKIKIKHTMYATE